MLGIVKDITDSKGFSFNSFDTVSTKHNDVKIANIFNIARRKRIQRLPSYSDESDDQYEVSVDGTNWEKGCTSGRPRHHFTFKKNNGPTFFAKNMVLFLAN